MKNSLLAIFFVGLLFSCAAPITVKVKSSQEEKINLDQLNLSSVMIGPILQPDFPLIDAAAFNGRTNKISHQIMDQEERVIEEFKYILVNALEAHVPCPIVTSNQLNSELVSPYIVNRGLQVDNKNFPVVFFSDNDINVAQFGKGTNVNKIFKNDEGFKLKVQEVADKLELTNVVVSYNRLAVVGFGLFGSTGQITLQSYLFIYDSDGNLLLDARGWIRPESIKGRYPIEYAAQLLKFEFLAAELSKQVAGYIHKM